MRYKGEYSPSSLLDPQTNEWVSFEVMKRGLDESDYFSPASAGEMETDEKGEKTVEKVEKMEDEDKKMEDEDEDEDFGELFRSHMPGLMTKEELAAFPLGNVAIKVRGRKARAEHLVGFSTGNPVKTMIEEMVAAVGPEVGREMVVVL